MSEDRKKSKRGDLAALLSKLAAACRILCEVANAAVELSDDNEALAPPAASLVSCRACAATFNVSQQTIARLARDRRIPFVVVAGRRRFDVGAVRAALADLQAPSAPAPVRPTAGDVVMLSRPRRAGGAV